MSWRSVTMTKSNVDAYLARYVNNGEVPPFDYKKLSKTEHPNDWDPQAEVFPMDIDLEWGGIPKPAGWNYPAEYTKSRESGEAKGARRICGSLQDRLFRSVTDEEKLINYDRASSHKPGISGQSPADETMR